MLGSVCGSDLWYYRGESPDAFGPIGHEFVGVADQLGADVRDIAEACAVMDERRAVKSPLRVGTG